MFVTEHGVVRDISLTRDGLETIEPYTARFSRLDPWQSRAVAMPPDVVRLGYEYFPERDLVRTEFYNDFGRRFGLFRPMAATLKLAPGVIATASIERTHTKQLFEEDEKQRLAPYVPHIKRALQLRLRHQAARRDGVHALALDALAFGAVVADQAGHVVAANAAAEALERAGSGLKLGSRQRPIEALRSVESRRLLRLIHEAATGGAGGVMRLSDGNGAPSLLVLVTPLPRGAYAASGKGHALVTLRAASDSPAFNEAMLSALFGLSPAQAAIAYAIYRGRSPEEIAAERGVKISTLRTHLGEIFQRTGAESQRDLMRLLALLPPVR